MKITLRFKFSPEYEELVIFEWSRSYDELQKLVRNATKHSSEMHFNTGEGQELVVNMGNVLFTEINYDPRGK